MTANERCYRVEIYTTCEPWQMRYFRESLDDLGDRYFDDWEFHVLDASTNEELEYGGE